MVLGAYLDDDSNQYESLIFTLGANTLPPNLEAKGPIFETANPLSLWKYRLEKLFLCDQGSLSSADNEQLLVIGLIQADTDGQVQAHAPIFHLTGERAVHGVDDKDCECEDVHRKDRQEHEWDISHSEDGMLAV